MLAPHEMPLNFKTAEERQAWFREHAEHYTVHVRINRKACTSAYGTLDAARKAAADLAKDLKRPCMVYGVIGSSDQWLENRYPQFR
jgi:hypothetical protein